MKWVDVTTVSGNITFTTGLWDSKNNTWRISSPNGVIRISHEDAEIIKNLLEDLEEAKEDDSSI